MIKKITWRMIFTDFKKRHPKMSKLVTYWRPYDYSTVLIYLKGGMKLIYNYDDKRARIISQDEINN